MSQKNHIEGLIRLTTPMHCTMPGDKIKDATPTMQMSIITASGRDTVPYFPGNDLRGRMRRKAAAIVMPALVNEGGKMPIDLYAGLTCGASDASPENELTIEEALRSAKNVYMGLFGGGKRLLRSRFSVQDLIPVTQNTINTGLVPKKFEVVDPEKGGALIDAAWKLIGHTTMFRVDDVMRVTRPEELAATVQDAETSVSDYQAHHLGISATRKEEKKAKVTDEAKTKKSDTANMMAIQFVQPGTHMYFRMDFHDGVTDAQIGLMLLSLEALVNEKALGGWCRVGFGKYDIPEMDLVRDGERLPVFADAGDGYNKLSDAVAGLASAGRSEIAALSQADMLTYFKPAKAE